VGYVDLPDGVRIFGQIVGELDALDPDSQVTLETALPVEGEAGLERWNLHWVPLPRGCR
jgi:hypothetical protein